MKERDEVRSRIRDVDSREGLGEIRKDSRNLTIEVGAVNHRREALESGKRLEATGNGATSDPAFERKDLHRFNRFARPSPTAPSRRGFAECLVPRCPVRQPLPQLSQTERAFTFRQAARGVCRPQDAVRGCGNEPGRESRHPSVQNGPPRRIELTIEEGHPLEKEVVSAERLAPIEMSERGSGP